MSNTRQNIDVYLDVTRASRTNENGGIIGLPELRATYGSQVLFRFHIQDELAEGVDLGSGGDYWLGIAEDYDLSSPVLVESWNTLFNRSGDWEEIDKTTGKICCRTSLSDSELGEAMEGHETLKSKVALWHKPSGGSWRLLGAFELPIDNAACVGDEEESSSLGESASSLSSSHEIVVLASGFGNAVANGSYWQDGTYNSQPKYVNAAGEVIFYFASASRWFVSNVAGNTGGGSYSANTAGSSLQTLDSTTWSVSFGSTSPAGDVQVLGITSDSSQSSSSSSSKSSSSVSSLSSLSSQSGSSLSSQSSSSTSQSELGLRDSLWLYAPLDAGPGDVTPDESGNGYDGDVNSSSFVAGKVNNAMSGGQAIFNGVDAITGALTINYWFKTDGTGVLFERTSNKIVMFIGGDTRLWLQIDNSDAIDSGTVVTNNTWRMVTATYDDGTDEWELYVNGSSVGTVTHAYSDNTSAIKLGYGLSASNEFYDELAIWSRKLSGAEISSLYNGGSGLAF